jgi:hypothetical protein
MDALAYLLKYIKEPKYRDLEEEQAVARILRNVDNQSPNKSSMPLIHVVRERIAEQSRNRKMAKTTKN